MQGPFFLFLPSQLHVMFNLFKKKEQEIRITDKVFQSGAAKLKAMLAQWTEEKNTVFIFWFDESLREAQSFFAAQTIEPVSLLTPREVTSPAAGQHTGKTLVFAEHYPLRSRELELFTKLNLSSVQVYSSLDEPLFKQFGAEKIIQVMQQMGMKEDECIEHKMVSNSIRQIQEKIGKKILVDPSARSQADWLQNNYTP